MNLNYDVLLSSFAFNFNLRRYTAARKLVLAPLADARPDLLPPAAVTLRATEWAW